VIKTRFSVGIIVLLSVVLVGCAAKTDEPGAAVVPTFAEGEHYTHLAEPLPDNVAPVLLYFYYGCTSCKALALPLAEWSQSEGVNMGLVPVHDDSQLVDAARVFHALAVSGAGDRYVLGYDLFQDQNISLQGGERINAYLDRYQVNQNDFWQAWRSEAVEKRLVGSYWLTRAAGVRITPSFVVQGRYKVELPVINSFEELTELLAFLLSLETAAVNEKP
jgi:thiol:disulfide interchange protein DsbA